MTKKPTRPVTEITKPKKAISPRKRVVTILLIIVLLIISIKVLTTVLINNAKTNADRSNALIMRNEVNALKEKFASLTQDPWKDKSLCSTITQAFTDTHYSCRAEVEQVTVFTSQDALKSYQTQLKDTLVSSQDILTGINLARFEILDMNRTIEQLRADSYEERATRSAAVAFDLKSVSEDNCALSYILSVNAQDQKILTSQLSCSVSTKAEYY